LRTLRTGDSVTRTQTGRTFPTDEDLVLYEGDCIDLLSQVPDEYVNLVVTSPPYNLGKEYETRTALDDYVAWQANVIRECVRTLHRTGSICWQVGNYVSNGEIIPLDILLYPVFSSLGLQLRNRIVWHFGHGLHAKNRFSGRYEVILWFTKTADYTFHLDPVRVPQKYPQKKHYKGAKRGELSGNPLGKNPSDIWNIPNVKSNHVEKTAHPCQFPVELIERLVLSMTDERDFVLDPFLGVGTSAIAALMHGRRAIGAEKSSEYLGIARQRISLAQKGLLRTRPMGREVYDPSRPKTYVSPSPMQLRLQDNGA